MKLMIKTIFSVWGVICMLLFFETGIFAQISQGGEPIVISSSKNKVANIAWYKTPVAKNEKYSRSQDESIGNSLKPLRFAHTFDVELNPKNAGLWVTQNKYKIWTLGIESTDAYSINLIFRNFHLPPGARLFIYNSDRTELIGAFTEKNNNEAGIFPTQPVSGDKIIVQYEELMDSEFEGMPEISRISHDYLGVTLKGYDKRRPLNTSGSCNVNVNCEEGINNEDAKNSVCRIFINGDELCTGVLVNNTATDGKPYVLTAGHCIDNNAQAQTSLFLFNYESPYCGSIDGDNTHSISGSTLKARFDSLDFALVELSIPPPNSYRPYYAGWDVSGEVVASSFAIHHPMGDVKKIAIDKDSPVTATYNTKFTRLAFWNVLKWDVGVTEIGSSGGPLFNVFSRVIGSLTGGDAYCGYPENDFYEKISKSWDYKSNSSMQLKAWLDPLNTGKKKINGYNPYSADTKCGAFTNFALADTTHLIRIEPTTPAKGFYSGTNTEGIVEFAEKFAGFESCSIDGVSLGVAKSYLANANVDAWVEIKVYEGDEFPTTLVYSENYSMKIFAKDAMNYLAFKESVNTCGDFFISYSLNLLNPTDTFAVYQAKREEADNSFFVKTSNGWLDYKTVANTNAGSSLLMELVACNIDNNIPSSIDSILSEFKIFPIPLSSGGKLTVQSKQIIEDASELRVFNLLGQQVPFQLLSENEHSIQLKLCNARMGIYFLQLRINGKKYTEKFSVVY